MEQCSRCSSESLCESESLLLPISEKSGKPSNSESARKRLQWTVLVPWILNFILSAVIIAQSKVLYDDSRCYWSRKELGKSIFILIRASTLTREQKLREGKHRLLQYRLNSQVAWGTMRARSWIDSWSLEFRTMVVFQRRKLTPHGKT